MNAEAWIAIIEAQLGNNFCPEEDVAMKKV